MDYKKGCCYFLFGFYDRNLKFPLIQTFVYLCDEVDEHGVRTWFFQSPEFFNEHIEIEKNIFGLDGVIALKKENLDAMEDCMGLMHSLQKFDETTPTIDS